MMRPSCVSPFASSPTSRSFAMPKSSSSHLAFAGEHDVVGLQIAMDQAPGMSASEAADRSRAMRKHSSGGIPRASW